NEQQPKPVRGDRNEARHMLPKGIAHFIASCGFEAEDLPAPDKLVLSRRLLGAQRHRCGNQCKGGRGKSPWPAAIHCTLSKPSDLSRAPNCLSHLRRDASERPAARAPRAATPPPRRQEA